MELTAAEVIMLEWVEKLTLTPALCTEADTQRLREVGWTDRDILDIAHVCAYFNFRVRIVDGLGLELGEWQINRSRAGSPVRGVEFPGYRLILVGEAYPCSASERN